MFQGQRTETERALLLRSKNFRQSLRFRRDICTMTEFFFFFSLSLPPFEFNQGRAEEINRGRSLHLEIEVGSTARQGKRHCSLDRGRGGREKNKIHASNRMFFSNRILVENPSFLVPPLERIIGGSILRGSIVYPFKGTKYSPTIPTVRTLNILASKEEPLWSNCIQHVRAF